MLQRIKRAICRLLGIKTRPYLRPLPEGPIIESLTPSTLIHRRKPVGPPNEVIRHFSTSHRSEPVYDKTWPDPFREQRPTRYDPAPRPVLRLVSDDTPPATPMEIIFAEGVIGNVSSTPPLPTPAPLPEPEPAPYNSDFGCSRDYSADPPSSPD